MTAETKVRLLIKELKRAIAISFTDNEQSPFNFFNFPICES